MTKELLDLLGRGATSSVGNSRLQPILDPTIQRHLSKFSLITHNFGTAAMIAVLSAFQSYLNEMVVWVDKLQVDPKTTPSKTKNDPDCDHVIIGRVWLEDRSLVGRGFWEGNDVTDFVRRYRLSKKLHSVHFRRLVTYMTSLSRIEWRHREFSDICWRWFYIAKLIAFLCELFI